MHFDTLDFIDEITKVMHNPYIDNDADIALKKALKNIFEKEKNNLFREDPISEESIELFRQEMQKHAFEGENSFSIKHINLFSIINDREYTSFLKWCKENDIEVTTNTNEKHETIYTFAWEN